MKWILAVGLCVPATSAVAQSIYKCRDAQGQAVYQSEPCPEAEKRWDTQARDYTWDDHTRRQAADRKIESDRRHVQSRARAITGGSRGQASAAVVAGRDSSACEAARSQRDAAYARMGTQRSFQASRYWDNLVWEACK